MTVAFGFAGDILNGLVALNGADLPLALVSKVRRVLRNFKTETEDLLKDKQKILQKHCTIDNERGVWMFPKQEDENFAEFSARWEELHNHGVIFPYEPILYDDIIDATPDEIKKKIVAKGSDFDVLESLNEVYNKQFKQNEIPPATVVNDNGASTPEANA